MEAHSKRYQWRTTGDINAYFGLLLDNLAGLVLTVSLLVGVFGMPADFVVGAMIPGTAIGVLVGDLLYSWLAFRLAKATNREDVTAMPLGLDTPSIFGITMFVVGPAYQVALGSGEPTLEAAKFAWGVGICSMIFSGVFKAVCSVFGNYVRRVLPRAGLFGSLASIALVIISFVPLIDIFHTPIAGLVALAIVLTTLIGKVPLPGKVPGTVAALIVGCILHYLTAFLAGQPVLPGTALNVGFFSTHWLEAFQFGWVDQLAAAIYYLPLVLPFALATVVGGLDCTESAAAAGDHYSTSQVLGIEAFATLVAGFCGGVIQTTPYIGHPAYKAMGGRAAYTLGTALTIGMLGILGGFEYFYMFVPKAAVFPILVFVGLEIASQGFHATPKRHYPALVLACVPPLAFLAFLFVDQILGSTGISIVGTSNNPSAEPSIQVLREIVADNSTGTAALDNLTGRFSLRPDLRENLIVVLMLKNGFVLTSLLWASILAMAIDRRMTMAAIFTFTAMVFTLFGFMHSPVASNALFLPWPVESTNSLQGDNSNGSLAAWALPPEMLNRVWIMAGGYLLLTILYVAWGRYLAKSETELPISNSNDS